MSALLMRLVERDERGKDAVTWHSPIGDGRKRHRGGCRISFYTVEVSPDGIVELLNRLEAERAAYADLAERFGLDRKEPRS